MLVGQGPEKESLERVASAERLRNVVFLPPVPRVSVGALLDHFDACYIGLKRSPLFRFGVSPNKLLDYMMAGRPVIHAIDAGNDLVAGSGCGVSVPPEDPGAIADAVRRLMRATPAERLRMGRAGRAYVLKHHDYRVLAERFLEAIEAPAHQAVRSADSDRTSQRRNGYSTAPLGAANRKDSEPQR